MSDTQMLARQAPKTGPWIIAYVVWLSAGFIIGSQIDFTAEPWRPALFWSGLLGIVAMIIYTSWQRHQLLGTLSAASRKFWPRIVLWSAMMFGGFCAIAAAQFLLPEPPSYWQALAIPPFVGIAGMIWCVHQYVRDETDEFLRSQAVRQLLIASFFTLIACTFWGALSATQIVTYGGTAGEVTLAWFAGLGIGRLVNELLP